MVNGLSRYVWNMVCEKVGHIDPIYDFVILTSLHIFGNNQYKFENHVSMI